MPGECFGGAGHHKIGTEGQRLLTQRCRSGVIDQQAASTFAADSGQPWEVHHIESRICRRLGQHDVGGLSGFIQICRSHLAHDDTERGKAFPGITAHLVVPVTRNDEH